MSASIAIQILPKVETDAEVVRIVDDVIAYIQIPVCYSQGKTGTDGRCRKLV
jgi:uncharacterized protein YqgV (UPF0045/DUF77 family)